MKKNLQTQLQSVLGWIKRNFISIIAVIIIIFLIVHYNSCKPDVRETSHIPEQLKPVENYIDKEGTKHAVIPTNVVSRDIMEYRLDSLRRALKASYINALSNYTTGVDTVFTEVPVYVPVGSSDSFIVDKSDGGYLTMITKGSTKTKQSSMTLELNDTLGYVDYTKKKFLRANLRNVDISNKNPYVKIKYGSNLTLREPKVLATFGPSVGYGVAFTSDGPVMAPMVGLTLTLNVFSIKSK